MAVSLTSADKALKTAYLDVVTNYLDHGVNPFFAKIKKTSDNVWGKEIKKLIRMGHTGGVLAGTETGSLPTAYNQTYKQFTITLKNLYGTIEISDKAIRASQNKSGSFVNILDEEIQALLDSANYNFSRMLFGDGNGIIGQIDTYDGEGLFKVTNVDRFKVGMQVMFYKSNYYLNEGKVYTVTQIFPESESVIFDENIKEITGGEYIVYPNAYGNELTGLDALFNPKTTKLYGLTKSSNKEIVPQTLECDGELTEMFIQKAIDNVKDKFGTDVDFILCSSGVKRAFIEHMSTYRRNVDMLELKGGFKTVSYNGIPIVSDRFCQEGTMYLLNSDDFAIYQLCDWEWIENEDGKILHQIPDKAVYRATLVKYAELLCSRPWAQTKITGITEA